MSKPPSIETQLRSAKRQLAVKAQALSLATEKCAIYRGRATKAEQEAADWKRRFDLLLEKIEAVELKP